MTDVSALTDLPTPASGDFILTWRGTAPYRLNLSQVLFKDAASGHVGLGANAESKAALLVTGAGQAVANITDAGSHDDTIYVRGNGTGAGAGGVVAFGSTFGNSTPFAAIKGFVTNGATNTIGDLVFSLRAAVADTFLTEQARIQSDGKMTVGGDTTVDWLGSSKFAVKSSYSGGRALSAWHNFAGAGAAIASRVDNTASFHLTCYYTTTYLGGIYTNDGTTLLFGHSSGSFVAVNSNGITVNKSLYNSGGYTTTYHLDTSGGAVVIANGAGVDVSNFSGMLVCTNYSNGATVIFICGGGNIVKASTTNVSDGFTGSYQSGVAGYRVTNNSGVATQIGVAIFRTRATA